LLIVSVLILAGTILFTACYALFLSPVTKLNREGAAPASAPGATLTETVKPESTRPPVLTDATPDWMEAEKLLDELAAQTPEPRSAEATPEPRSEAAAETAANPFTDVKETDYFYAPALWAAEKGILTGDKLSPQDDCTRAQAITFLWRQAGSPEPTLQVSPFLDIAGTDYFYKPVLWAFESGMISASQEGKFKPSDAVTRAQMALFLYRMEGGSADGLENPFTDVAENSYYHDAALWAYHRGIVNAGEKQTFNADAKCTRGQFITFLYRCFAM
jgi:hypothetical protein